MVILAVNEANDRGTAFEKFMSIILSNLGYEIINVKVRKSGRELDIQATATVTGEPLLVECKAHSAVIAGPEFSKFCGVYDHERSKNSRLFGLMVSLSGFNSEVKAYYEEKPDRVKKRFKISGPNEITELAVRADLIADDRTIKHEASKSWPFELGETLLIITKIQFFRIQILKKDGKKTHFIAYRDHGQAPTTHEIQTLKADVPYIENLEPLNIAARKELIIALAKSKRPLSLARLKQLSKQSTETINAEIGHFEERKIITKRRTSFCLSPDLAAFCEIFKEVYSNDDDFKYKFLQSHYFKSMNTDDLVSYCLNRRNITLDIDRIQVLKKIFYYSPSVLDFALFDDTSRYNRTFEHANQIQTDLDEINTMSISQFFSELIHFLLSDLHDSSNINLRTLDGIPTLYEEHKVILGTAFGRIFKLASGGTISFVRSKGSIEAGDLVSGDHFASIHIRFSQFHITEDIARIDEAADLVNGIEVTSENLRDVSAVANNIGLVYWNSDRLLEAQSWFEEGLLLDDSIAEIHANLAGVIEQMGAPKSEFSIHLTRAKELDPDKYGDLQIIEDTSS